MKDCIFCKIANGTEKSYTFWEDDKHIAFLSIFPNTQGTTVVIPKQHYPSYAFDLPDQVLSELVIAAKKVAKHIDRSFHDVGRTAMVLEGFGIDHVHAK